MSQLERLRNLRWYKGHLEKFWNLEDFVNLEYVKQDVTDHEKEEWIRLGYDPNTSFTGTCYSNKNQPPAFVEKFKEHFTEFTNLTFTFYKMQTQDIMPEHVDHFSTYKRLFNVESEDVVRILVMLEDWKPGHYLEISSVGIVNWVAGDYFMWENEVAHAASNIGKMSDPRYSLQITATKKRRLTFDKLYSFNVSKDMESTGLPEKYVVDRLRRAVNNNNGKPYQIFTGNNNIKAYENMPLTEETKDKLNEQGLSIYLYEPLCSYHKDAVDNPIKHSERFYSEFDEYVKPEDLRSDELDSIVEFKNKNNLNNITVHTCDYDVKKYYPHYKDLNLITDDIFLKAEHVIPIMDTEYPNHRDFTNKFLCMNYRYTYHRHLLSCYAAQTEDAIISWIFKSELEHIMQSPWHDLNRIEQKDIDAYNKIKYGLNILNNNVPLNIDFDFSEPTIINHFYHKNVFPDNKNIANHDIFQIIKTYRKIFCEIVGETRFGQPTANYSEKVYRPMFYLRPFIVGAPPYTLQYIREQGFMTFNDFWDESYDTTECHEDRLLKIFKVIDKINNMSMEECVQMHKDMMPILHYNQRIVQKKTLPV